MTVGRSGNLYEETSSAIKITPFLLDQCLQNIVGQTWTTLNLQWIMSNQKNLFVNLELGNGASSLIGKVLINLILITALQPSHRTEEQRRQVPFHLIVDEH